MAELATVSRNSRGLAHLPGAKSAIEISRLSESSFVYLLIEVAFDPNDLKVLFTLCQFGAWLAVVVGLILDAPGQGLGLCSFGGPFSGSAVSPNLNITIEAFRYAELSASIISDVLITVSMVYYLRIGIYETNLFGYGDEIVDEISHSSWSLAHAVLSDG
ncbi:hypothetical protein EYR38_006256 [Pleurotus pulmonarius]|nr:hypothetical protein EYR38_006256 [Pleurotus pulmonarius]